MDTITFVRKPLVVEAVEVTAENMEEIAKAIGDVRQDEHGKSYIFVDRRIVQNAYKVWPGFWVTYMGDNIHCYSRKAFRQQFVQGTPEVKELISKFDSEAVNPTNSVEVTTVVASP